MFWKLVVRKANSRRKNTDFMERIAVKRIEKTLLSGRQSGLSCEMGMKGEKVTSLYWARFRVRAQFAGVSSDIEFRLELPKTLRGGPGLITKKT